MTQDSALRTQDSAQRLSRGDKLFVATCVVLFAAALYVILRYFAAAFPEASIEFAHDRASSEQIARELLASQRLDPRGYKHAAVFDAHDAGRIFLERSLGLEKANALMGREVHVWYWHHRWFRPLQEEEFAVDIAPAGAIVHFTHHIPEERAMADPGAAAAKRAAEAFLARVRAPRDLQLVAQSERRLPKRMQRIFTWESRSIRPANAPYRHVVTVDGGVVTDYAQRLKVPDQWLRSYREMRSKNEAAGAADTVLMAIIMIAAVVVFVARLRRGDIHLRFVLALGAVAVVLVTGVTLNSLPSSLASYDTTQSFPAWVAEMLFFALMQSVGTAMLLVVICGAGEVLYRERLPQHLAIPRLWTPRALASKRVFRSLVLGYTLVPLFIAYQVVFYVVAQRFGAWSPADIPYDDILSSALPWVAVLFAGFFPAFSEEFLSRAFSIPFLQRFLRWRFLAIVVAGFLWGFGHAMYPQQPFWIRGVEVGIAGVVAGLLMDRYGLLALLIWHYTIDAIYTALLLFRSGNAYYIFSAGLASLIFAVPLVVAVVLYIRNRGFIPDDDLTNASLPLSPPPEPAVVDTSEAPFPPSIRVTPRRIAIAVVLIIAAIALVLRRPASPDDAVNYRITADQAKQIAQAHLRGQQPSNRVTQQPIIIAAPAEGFRYWQRESPREDGGAPGGFDDVAATYIARRIGIRRITDVFRDRIEAGTYSVRFFTPGQKEEHFVEVDPRTSRVIGYHKYQDEQNAGAQLEREAALAIARRAFATYGVDAARFDLREALTYQQPRRRDWLFHFEERTPIVADAYRRATVRVAGSEVTQFAKHVKVPHAAYREAEKRTVANVILGLLQLVATIAALAIVIIGLITATRRAHLPWRRAAKWALVFSIIPIARVVAGYEESLFGYGTSVAWETFRVQLAINALVQIGRDVALVFIAVAGIDAVLPHASRLLGRDGRARFGRSAALSALAAIAAVIVVFTAVDAGVAALQPSAVVVSSVDAPDEVVEPLPALLAIGGALLLAVILSGAIALVASVFADVQRKWIPAAIAIALVFCFTIDPRATPVELPLMLLSSIVVAAMTWLIARHLLGANPLAWPLAAFGALALDSALTLLRHDRPDLRANGIALLVVVALVFVWIATPRETDA